MAVEHPHRRLFPLTLWPKTAVPLAGEWRDRCLLRYPHVLLHDVLDDRTVCRCCRALDRVRLQRADQLPNTGHGMCSGRGPTASPPPPGALPALIIVYTCMCMSVHPPADARVRTTSLYARLFMHEPDTRIRIAVNFFAIILGLKNLVSTKVLRVSSRWTAYL